MGEHIPKFKTEEEEIAFWDKTSVTDIAPDLVEEIQIERPSRPLSSTFAIRLDQKTVELLREIAGEYQLGPTQLVRKWVLERVQLEIEAGVLATPTTDFNPGLERIIRKKVLESLVHQLPRIAEMAVVHVDTEVVNEAAESYDIKRALEDA